jgi:hypothetical protein
MPVNTSTKRLATEHNAERDWRAAKRAKATKRGQRAAKRANVAHRMYVDTLAEIFIRKENRANLSEIAFKEADAKYLAAYVAFRIAGNDATIKRSVVREAYPARASNFVEAYIAYDVAYKNEVALYEEFKVASESRVLARNVLTRDSMAMSLASENFTSAKSK